MKIMKIMKIMKNLKSTIRFSQQCFISGVLLFSTYNAFALSDEVALAKEKLLQQLTQEHKVQPTLYFENNKLRIFGENNSDLLREKSELLTAVNVFDENFGSSPKLDIALMNNQISLLQLDTSEMSDQYLGFMSYQGLGKSQKKESNNRAKKFEKYNIIAHEACHKLLIHQVEDKGLKAESNGELVYGHGLLPDWFDEMAAVMCENQILTDMRLTDEIDNFIPFEDFFIMENPAFTLLKKQMNRLMQQQLKKTNDKKTTVAMVVNLDDNNAQLSSLFYQQSSLFHHFLSEKLGRKIFKQLTQKFIDKTDVTAWLLQELSLDNSAELDVMFKRFYQKK